MRLRTGWLAIWATVLLALGGCSAVIYEDAIKLCRSMIPPFNASDAKLDVRRTDAGPTVHGTLVTVMYIATRPGEPPQRRAVSCILQTDAARPGRFLLSNMATEDGPLGDVRLHLLRRHWIESGQAIVSDPSPIALNGFMPELSRGAAEALQVLLASLPGLSIYALLAAAYALIYGLVGRINLAFGELGMLSGYGAFLGFSMIGADVSLGLAVLAAILVGLFTCMTHGAALGHLVFRRLVDRPGQHMLIATIGLSMAWSELARVSQGSGNRWIAPVLSRPIGIARADDYIVTVTPLGLIVPIIGLTSLAILLQLLAGSRFGRRWQAFADDPFAASLFGINPAEILFKTMVLASVLAGIGGLLTVFTYGGVGHGGGLVVGLKALMAAVIGGIGSVWAAVLGALLLGAAEALWSAAFRIEFRDPALFAALALVLILKPEGLFAKRQ